MPDRLMLNTVGIKSPLDVRSRKRTNEPAGTASMHARRALNPRPVISPTPHALGGAPKLTAVALDEDLAQRLDRTARAAGVSANGLAVAALDAALADHPQGVRITDQRRRPTRRTTRRTLRLPPHLRHRADTLSEGGASSAATRSELINTAIRRGLPDSPRLALALVIVAATAAPTAP